MTAATLTIFTPTYNRAHTLPRVFASLQAQTSRDFRWLVVNDGSTDSTQSLVDAWRQVADFDIEYVYQPNGGKHSAHNLAVARAETPLLSIVDSDDELLPEAVAEITSEWKGMSDDERARLAGIWTLCRDPSGRIIGGGLDRRSIDATLQELRYGSKLDIEMLPTFVTSVLRQHPFPSTPPGACPYIPEAYVWTRITRDRPLRFLNIATRIYHQGDGLIAMSENEYRLSRAMVYGYLAPLANEFSWFWHDVPHFVMSAIQASRYALFSRQFVKLAATLPLAPRLLFVAATPAALLLILKDWASGRIRRQLRDGPTQANPAPCGVETAAGANDR